MKPVSRWTAPCLVSAGAVSGLGWSIMKRISKVFDVKLQTGRSSRLGGLAITVYWPASI